MWPVVSDLRDQVLEFDQQLLGPLVGGLLGNPAQLTEPGEIKTMLGWRPRAPAASDLLVLLSHLKQRHLTSLIAAPANGNSCNTR